METLDTLVEQHGLQGQRDAVLATVRPAVLLKLGEAEPGPVGCSRIGGFPDLPASIPWPASTLKGYYRCFVLQINLAQLPDFENNPFPRQGMLYLFTEDNDDRADQIIVYRGDETLTSAEPPDSNKVVIEWFEEARPHRLTFEAIDDIPRWATDDHVELGEILAAATDDPEAETTLDDLGRSLSNGSVGKLLGHVAGIGHDPRESAYVSREVDPGAVSDYERRSTIDMAPARKWHNLLQVDSSNALTLMFGDAGYLNVMIHEDDLARPDFSRVYVNLESS